MFAMRSLRYFRRFAGASEPHRHRDTAALRIAPGKDLDAFIGLVRDQKSRRFADRCADEHVVDMVLVCLDTAQIAEQDPDLDAVFIAVGAGGLMGGAGTALHALRADIEVVGVWAEASL